MNLLFAADMSFNFVGDYPGDAQARRTVLGIEPLFRAADFSVVNLENVLGDAAAYEPILKSGPALISDQRFAEYIFALHTSAIGMANNHAGDYTAAPLLDTRDLFEKRGYTVIGAGKNLAEAYRPAVFEKDGQTAHVIAVCENEFGCATEEAGGAAGFSLAYITRAIREAQSVGAYPIVYFHGGHEGNPFPSPKRIELYRHLVDMGAAAVIAMHAHCPQGYEMYEGAPIVYGMGNLFFPFPNVKSSWYYGYLTALSLSEDGVSLETHPYRFDEEGIFLLTGDDKTRFDAYMAELCAPIGDKAAIAALFDAWCAMPERYGYYRMLTDFDVSQLEESDRLGTVDLKNNFGCEAHNELLTNMLSMIYAGRREEALRKGDYIRRLQNMEL